MVAKAWAILAVEEAEFLETVEVAAAAEMEAETVEAARAAVQSEVVAKVQPTQRRV